MIVTLIAAYRDDPKQLERIIDIGLSLGPVCVAATDNPPPLQLVGAPGLHWMNGNWDSERDKRNALLGMAKHHGIGREDWLLTLDADEKLLNPEMLQLQLDRVPAGQLFYPLIRVEPRGEVWEMPCKLFRCASPTYIYLDVGVRFGSINVNLDPWHVGKRATVDGWPIVAHYGSPRAATDPEHFYSEKDPPPDFQLTYKDWRQDREHPGGYVVFA